jgi:hypothetical protein
MNSFDTNSIDFVKEAVSLKKWAFEADYIRLYALYTEGGIYLDSDVLVQKSFDPYLANDFFTAVEYHPYVINENNTLERINADGTSKKAGEPKPGIGIQAAVIASAPHHPFLKDVMQWYKENHFILPDGSLNNFFIAPDVLAMYAEKYGFRYANEEQRLQQGMLILPSSIIAGDLNFDVNDSTVALHMTLNSWKPKQKKHPLRDFIKKLKANVFLRKLFGKEIK